MSTGLNIVGLLPLPTLSKNQLLFLVVRTVHEGQVSPSGRNVMGLINVMLLFKLVFVIVFGSVQGLFVWRTENIVVRERVAGRMRVKGE